jgi:hypothetical protein
MILSIVIVYNLSCPETHIFSTLLFFKFVCCGSESALEPDSITLDPYPD